MSNIANAPGSIVAHVVINADVLQAGSWGATVAVVTPLQVYDITLQERNSMADGQAAIFGRIGATVGAGTSRQLNIQNQGPGVWRVSVIDYTGVLANAANPIFVDFFRGGTLA